MNQEPRRKKRSEKLSDSFVARLSREIGTSTRLGEIAAEGRAHRERTTQSTTLASLQSQPTHAFKRCPHCREFVPLRADCRACGAAI